MARNKSGMSRRRFIGTGAAGVAAAGMAGSGVVSAKGSGMTAKVAIMYRQPNFDYMEGALAAAEVLNQAGIETFLVHVHNSSSTAKTYTKALLTGENIPSDPQFDCVNPPYDAIISGGSSSITREINYGIEEAGVGPIEHISAIGVSDLLNPHHPESMHDPDLVKFHRTAVTGFQWGQAAANAAIDALWDTGYSKYFIRRFEDPPDGPTKDNPGADPPQYTWLEDPFGISVNEGFDDVFVSSTVIYMDDTGTRFFKSNPEYQTELNKWEADVEMTLEEWLGLCNPPGEPPDGVCENTPPDKYVEIDLLTELGTDSKLVGSSLANQNAENVVNALIDTGNDNLRLASTGTVNARFGGDVDQNKWLAGTSPDYDDGHAIGTVAHYAIDTDPYNAWHAGWNSWIGAPYLCKPSLPLAHYAPRFADAAHLLVGGLYGWKSNNYDDLWQLITDISSPPGKASYPYDLNKLNSAHSVHDSDDYQGASGPVDLIKISEENVEANMIRGEPKHSAFTLWVGPGYEVNGVPPTVVSWSATPPAPY